MVRGNNQNPIANWLSRPVAHIHSLNDKNNRGYAFMPGLHFRLRYSLDKVRTNVDIRTLLRKLQDRVETFSFLLWLGTDLPTCLRELRDETRTDRECGRRDECTLHFIVLILSRRECKPGIRLFWRHWNCKGKVTGSPVDSMQSRVMKRVLTPWPWTYPQIVAKSLLI